MSPGWLVRKLHGQATASLEEMAEWLLELDLPAPSLEMALDAARRASPFYRDIEIIDAEDLSPEELERARAEQLETFAHHRQESDQ